MGFTYRVLAVDERLANFSQLLPPKEAVPGTFYLEQDCFLRLGLILETSVFQLLLSLSMDHKDGYMLLQDDI